MHVLSILGRYLYEEQLACLLDETTGCDDAVAVAAPSFAGQI